MTLGISLNSRIVAMALLDKEGLVDYRIKLFKERWTTEKLKRMIDSVENCITEHRVDTVVLIVPCDHHTSREGKELLGYVQAHFRKYQICLHCLKATALHAFSGDARAKKKALMHELVLLYPELSLAHRKELRNKKKYYNKLFEAVGAATLHRRQATGD